MQGHATITIANELDLQDVQRASDMPCDAVLDLRFTSAANARPVEEEVLLRLRNLQVGYDQLPIDLKKPHGWQKNHLRQRISESHGRMMIITDQPEVVSAFCRDINVPETSVARNARTPASTIPHQRPQPGIGSVPASAAA